MAGLGGLVGCASDWRPGGRGFNPAEVGNILSWRLIMKYFLRPFSPFRWFKKGSWQFLAKECAQYCLTACPVNVWIGKLTWPHLGWLGRKTSTQTKLNNMLTLYIRTSYVSFNLRGPDTLGKFGRFPPPQSPLFIMETSFVTSFFTSRTLIHFWKRFYPKRKEFAPTGSNFFPFGANSFLLV